MVLAAGPLIELPGILLAGPIAELLLELLAEPWAALLAEAGEKAVFCAENAAAAAAAASFSPCAVVAGTRI